MVSFHILQRILRTEFLRLKYRGLANHPLLASLPEHAKTHAAKRMFFAPSARFFFARIPKNANSTLVRTFAAHLGHDVDADPIGAKAKDRFRNLPTLAEYQSCYRVVVLRDPFARILSAWLDKGHLPAFARKNGFEGGGEALSGFDRFLDGLAENQFYRNGHFLPQMDLIPGKIGDYRLARVETLDDDLPRICHEAFGTWRGLQSRQTGRTHAMAAVRDLDDGLRKKIARLYENDLDHYHAIRQ